MTSSNVTLQWEMPITTGRSDYYYKVEYSDPDNVGIFLTSIDNLRDTRFTVSHTITGLRPATEYVIRVSVHNGINYQDPDVNSRLQEIRVTTDITSKSRIDAHAALIVVYDISVFTLQQEFIFTGRISILLLQYPSQ